MENLTENQSRKTSSPTKKRSLSAAIKSRIFSSKEIEKRYSFKIARKMVHVAFSSFGFAFLFLEDGYKPYVAYVLYILTALSILGDTIRIYVPVVNRLIYRYFTMLFIPRDQHRYSSGAYYLIGASIASILFPYKIAGMGIVFLGIGDFMASLGGTYLKRYFPYQLPKTHKTWVGLFCFVITTNIVGYFAHIPLYPCLVSSVFAALSEVYLVNIDDNLSIPIIGSLSLYLLAGGI